jgi:hypothetical protein
MSAIVGEQIHHEEAVLPAPDHQVFLIAALFRNPAEKTRLVS